MPDFTFEMEMGGVVAGIDEVGRGPLAGPVIAAAVVIPPQGFPDQAREALDDSKKLTARKREALEKIILETCHVGFGEVDVAEIDRVNILQATFIAMGKAFSALKIKVDGVLVDGNRKPLLPGIAADAVRCLIKGDGLSFSIAAASVVAKVRRDRIMTELALTYPGYGWEKNAGYGTALHLAGLAQLGVTPHHRMSFAPCRETRDRGSKE